MRKQRSSQFNVAQFGKTPGNIFYVVFDIGNKRIILSPVEMDEVIDVLPSAELRYASHGKEEIVFYDIFFQNVDFISVDIRLADKTDYKIFINDRRHCIALIKAKSLQ